MEPWPAEPPLADNEKFPFLKFLRIWRYYTVELLQTFLVITNMICYSGKIAFLLSGDLSL